MLTLANNKDIDCMIPRRLIHVKLTANNITILKAIPRIKLDLADSDETCLTFRLG